MHFSDRGIPDGYHNMDGFSGNTFKFVKADGKYVYARIRLKPDNGYKVLDPKRAVELAGSNPDYGIQSLFEAIEKEEYPSWTAFIVSLIEL